MILYARKEYPELFNAASLFLYIGWDVLLTFRSLQNKGSLFFRAVYIKSWYSYHTVVHLGQNEKILEIFPVLLQLQISVLKFLDEVLQPPTMALLMTGFNSEACDDMIV